MNHNAELMYQTSSPSWFLAMKPKPDGIASKPDIDERKHEVDEMNETQVETVGGRGQPDESGPSQGQDLLSGDRCAGVHPVHREPQQQVRLLDWQTEQLGTVSSERCHESRRNLRMIQVPVGDQVMERRCQHQVPASHRHLHQDQYQNQ